MLSREYYNTLCETLAQAHGLMVTWNNPLDNDIYLIEDYIVIGAFQHPIELIVSLLHEIAHTKLIYPTVGHVCERTCWLMAFKALRDLNLHTELKYSHLKRILARIKHEPINRTHYRVPQSMACHRCIYS
jgi:hypothetical protein